VSRWLRSRTRRSRVSLGLSATGVAMVWRAANGSLEHRVSTSPLAAVPEIVAGWVQGTPTLASLLKGRPMSVTMAEDLVRWWLVKAPLGARSLSELEAFARLRHEELFGQKLDEWTVQCRWRLDGPSVCCALSGSAAACAQALRSQVGLSLSDICPATQRLMDIWRKAKHSPDVLVCRSSSDRAVAWWSVDGAPVELRAVRLPVVDPMATLDRELARMSSRRSEALSREQESPAPDRAVLLDAFSSQGAPAFALNGWRAERYELPSLAAVPADSPAAMAAALGAAHLEGSHEFVAGH